MKNYTVFDVETGCLPDGELPPFDKSTVLTGNVKDEAKIAAKVAAAEAEYRANAALDALTGRVLVVGTITDGVLVTYEQDEPDLLADFWNDLEPDETLIGFNCNSFDLPFLFRRSWHHGITPPAWLRHGRYWSDSVIDLRDVWQLGDRQAHGSLETIARLLALPPKLGKGSDFAALYATDKSAALVYLHRDLEITLGIAKRLGVVPA